MAASTVESEHFAARPESAAAARHFVADAVRATHVDLTDVLLLTSELVTNAIIHADGEFEVRVSVEAPDEVCVMVLDHAPEVLLVVREAQPDGGRGLVLIDRLASAWGFERQPDAKLVWFRLSCSGPQSAS